MERFQDRRDAGRRLALALSDYRGRRAAVLGLARGGMIVADEVARALDADLDVFVARKVGAPSNKEYGIGAVAPDGARFFDDRAVAAVGLSSNELEALAEREEEEMERRLRAYRGALPMPDLEDRIAILVDDGLATGVTAVAAARSLRRLRPARLVLAVPVGAQPAIDRVSGEVDEVVCPHVPPDLRSVGEWYDVFDQTTDDEVRAILSTRIRVPAAPVARIFRLALREGKSRFRGLC